MLACSMSTRTESATPTTQPPSERDATTAAGWPAVAAGHAPPRVLSTGSSHVLEEVRLGTARDRHCHHVLQRLEHGSALSHVIPAGAGRTASPSVRQWRRFGSTALACALVLRGDEGLVLEEVRLGTARDRHCHHVLQRLEQLHPSAITAGTRLSIAPRSSDQSGKRTRDAWTRMHSAG